MRRLSEGNKEGEGGGGGGGDGGGGGGDGGGGGNGGGGDGGGDDILCPTTVHHSMQYTHTCVNLSYISILVYILHVNSYYTHTIFLCVHYTRPIDLYSASFTTETPCDTTHRPGSEIKQE